MHNLFPDFFKIWPKKKSYSIYGFMDPRDAEFFYIGLSNNPQRRLSSHLAKASNGKHKNPRLGQRLMDILNDGYYPAMIILYVDLREDQVARVEKMVIRKFRKGHNLLNITDGGELGGRRKKRKTVW